MSKYVIFQTIPGQARALFLDVANGTDDAIELDESVVIFAVENGDVVRQPWDGVITPDKVFSATETRLLGIMIGEFHDCSVFEANLHPNGSISIGKQVDPSSV
jgi:hypothetical protein